MGRVTSSPVRVLVVEDEPDIADLLRLTLQREGDMVVDTARSGSVALERCAHRPPDLVLLDLHLPGIGGLEVCRRLRSAPSTATVPVIMVTARSSEADRVTGFEAGADDYVVKPFSPRELAMRVRAVLRRGPLSAAAAGQADVYRGTRLVADFGAVSIEVDGVPVRLTRREFELLHYLVRNRARVVSRARLLEQVWGRDHDVETRSVDVHVGRLRQKLGAAGTQIETVIGLGYRFTG